MGCGTRLDLEIVDRIEAWLSLIGVTEKVLEAVRRFRCDFYFFGPLLFLTDLDECFLLLSRHKLAILEVEQSRDINLLLFCDQLDWALLVFGASTP